MSKLIKVEVSFFVKDTEVNEIELSKEGFAEQIKELIVDNSNPKQFDSIDAVVTSDETNFLK